MAASISALALAGGVFVFRALREPSHREIASPRPADTSNTMDDHISMPQLPPTPLHEAPAPPMPSSHPASRASSSIPAEIPVRRLTAREERENYEIELEASGQTVAPWHKTAEDTYRSFQDLLAHTLSTRVRFTTARCFQAGCESTVVYPDSSSLEKAHDAIVMSEAFLRYPGGKFESGPEQASDGSWSNVWILFATHVTSP
jgi:hypothetical protein